MNQQSSKIVYFEFQISQRLGQFFIAMHTNKINNRMNELDLNRDLEIGKLNLLNKTVSIRSVLVFVDVADADAVGGLVWIDHQRGIRFRCVV